MVPNEEVPSLLELLNQRKDGLDSRRDLCARPLPAHRPPGPCRPGEPDHAGPARLSLW